MNWNERMELSQKRMEDIKKKMAASAESSKKARALKKEEIKADMADVNASIEKFADRVEKVVNDGLTESAEAIEDFADIVEVKVNDGLAKSGAAIEDFADDVEADVGNGFGLLYALGLELHVDGVLACRHVHAAEDIVGTSDRCFFAIDGGSPTWIVDQPG